MLASRAIATTEPSTPRGRFPSAAAGAAAHLLVAAWVFAPALFGGRVLYLRDISTYFHPNLVFLERSLGAGVFPLWNPAVDAGSPFLLVYPVDILLVAMGGASAALAIGPFLHMLLASLGASALGRHLGQASVTVVDLGAYDAARYGVSRQHAIIVNMQDSFTIQDLDSTNGTWLNWQRLEPGKPYPFSSGSQVRLGQFAQLFLELQQIPVVVAGDGVFAGVDV